MWLLCLAILMLFVALTSAYIVRKGDGFWYNFQMPSAFLLSTFVIAISSISMIYAFRSAKRDDIKGVQMGLIITVILGGIFCLAQYFGWYQLKEAGLTFVPATGDKMSATFLIAIAVVHLVHILGGLIFLLAVLVKALKSEVHKKNTLLIDMCNTYWHFIGILWVYLYLFLYFAPDY